MDIMYAYILIMVVIIAISFVLRYFVMKKNKNNMNNMEQAKMERDRTLGRLHLNVPEPKNGDPDPDFGTLQFIVETRKGIQITFIIMAWTIGRIAAYQWSEGNKFIQVGYHVAAILITVILVMQTLRKIYFYNTGIVFKKTLTSVRFSHNDVLHIKQINTRYNNSNTPVSTYDILLNDKRNIAFSGTSFKHIDWHMKLYQDNLKGENEQPLGSNA